MSTTKTTTKTAEQVRNEFVAHGINVSEWARERKVSRFTVIDLLRGKRTGRRGEAHKVAVMLGLKEDPNTARRAA